VCPSPAQPPGEPIPCRPRHLFAAATSSENPSQEANHSSAPSGREPLTGKTQTPAKQRHLARCLPEASAPDSLRARAAHNFGHAARAGGARHRRRATRAAAGRLRGLLRSPRRWPAGLGRGRDGRRRADARTGRDLRAGQRMIGDWGRAYFWSLEGFSAA